MIRLAVMSDLHLESGGFPVMHPACDLVVLAGDIGIGTAGLAYAAALAPLPVIYIPGNREHWGHAEAPIPALRYAAAGLGNIHLLHDDAVDLAVHGRRLTVLGCTLWTDFARDGPDTVAATMAAAEASMPDYRNIMAGPGQPLTAETVLGWHRASRAWLADRLAAPRHGPVVVVSHHPPSVRSSAKVTPGHVGQITSVSALDGLIAAHGPDLWIHGHTHSDCDYAIGGTRILSRQRGGTANTAFAPLIVAL